MTTSAFCHHLLDLKITVAVLTMLKKKKEIKEMSTSGFHSKKQKAVIHRQRERERLLKDC